MSALLATTKLHLNKRDITFRRPLIIVATVAFISVLIALLFLRGGSVPGSADWVSSSRLNPGMVYAFPGFLGYLGVQSVATTFPFALTLGATRRSFVGGTLVWAIITSAYLTAVLAILTMIEIATGHWFSHFYIFDIIVLGGGNLALLIPIVFLGTLSILTIGGVFGAAWIRFGARGPQLIAVSTVVVLIVALIVILPSAPAIIAAFQLWWLAIIALVAITLASVGMWLLLRNAIVR